MMPIVFNKQRAIELLVDALPPAARIVSTTGKASRELYELRLRSAAWYRDRLDDKGRAEKTLTEALQLDPEPLEAHEQVVALLRAQARTADLADALVFLMKHFDAGREREAEKMLELTGSDDQGGT